MSADRYLASDRFMGAREATRHQFGRIVRVAILPALGDRPLATIAPADLADWAGTGLIRRVPMPAPLTTIRKLRMSRCTGKTRRPT